MISRINGDKEKLLPQHIPVIFDLSENRTPMAVNLYTDICDRVFRRMNLIEFAHKVANNKRKIRRDELLYYLHSLHLIALFEIENAYVDHGLAPNRPLPTGLSPYAERFQRLLGALDRPETVTKYSEEIFKISSFIVEQTTIRHKVKLNLEEEGNVSDNRQFIVLDFPKEYIDRIETILYPPWYVACFMRTYENSSTWGNYADSHKGICLVFRTDHDGGRDSIALKRITGYSGREEKWSYSPMTVQEVTYGVPHDEIDFFRSLGRLPELMSMDVWYKDSTGEISECGSHVDGDMEAWRQNYWKSFYPSINKKAKDWEYERESRLVLFSQLDELSEKRQRKLKYKFSSLEGIIFGIRTSDSDKLKILEILRKKCKEMGRRDFQVLQAYYDHKTGRIGKYPMEIGLCD